MPTAGARGIVYACSHPRWLGEAIVSAQSARQHMPDLRRQMFITRVALNAAAGVRLQEHFTDVTVLDALVHDHRPRFEAILQTDLDQAIVLDGDTYFVEPAYELFELLDLYDIGVAQAPQYMSPRAVAMNLYEHLPKVSLAQPEWNAGVMVARLDARFRAVIAEWSRLFGLCRSLGFNMDQAAFRSALATSDLRIATLPNNYNFRAHVSQGVAGIVKILHAHGDLPAIARTINVNPQMRAYGPRSDLIHGMTPRA